MSYDGSYQEFAATRRIPDLVADEQPASDLVACIYAMLGSQFASEEAFQKTLSECAKWIDDRDTCGCREVIEQMPGYYADDLSWTQPVPPRTGVTEKNR